MLFELNRQVTEPGPAARPAEVVVAGPVSTTFRAFAPEQDLLLAPSLDGWLPAGHLARFIAELVDEHLHMSRIHVSYTGSRAPRRTTHG